MRKMISFSMILLTIPLSGQHDPCSVDRSFYCLHEEVERPKSDNKPKNSVREWNLMVAGAKNQQGCKFSVQSLYKANIRRQTNRYQAELSVFDETNIEYSKGTKVSVKRDLLRLGAEASANRPDKMVQPQACIVLQTIKCPVYEVKTDSAGQPKHIRVNGPLGQVLFYPSIGIMISGRSGLKFDLGLAGCKVIWRQRRFMPDEANERSVSLEGGLKVQLNITRTLFKVLSWEHATFAFWNIGQPAPEAEIRNQLMIQAGPQLKAGILTRYTYQRQQWPPGSFTGELSLGMGLFRPSN
jgi:hypothetical protein